MISRSLALYEIPKTWERARVLEDSFPGLTSIISDSVKSKYNNHMAIKTLLSLRSVNGELAGSNIPILIHLQELGYWSDVRFATRMDLENVKKFGPHFLSGNYVDFGIALRGQNVSCGCNISAINLALQLKQRGIKIGNGKLIPVSALTQREDTNSGYGLTLGLRGDVSNDTIQELGDFKWDYTTTEGIARAYLDRNGCWDSSCSNLVSSSDIGRMVILRPEVLEPLKF